MLFKHKHTELAEEVIESEADLERRIQTQIKKQKRRLYLRRIALSALLLIVGIGSLKSLFIDGKAVPYEKAINDYAFVQEYMEHYFHYPQTEEDDDYLQLFTVSTSWRNEYDQQIEAAELSDLNIYHVERNDNDSNTYYFKANANVHPKEGENQSLPFYMKLTLVQRSDAYLVIAPINMACTQTAGTDDESKKAFEKTSDVQGNDCSEAEKEELENTVRLFLKTYTGDFEQARLLMMNPEDLDPLDPSTEIALESVRNVQKSNTEYMVNADVLMTSGQVMIQRRTYCFVIDQASNKIIEMEEY